MEKDKTTGKPAKVKPEAVTEEQAVESTEKLETQQDSGKKEDTASIETKEDTTNKQLETVDGKSRTAKGNVQEPANEIAPNIRAQQEKDAAFIAPYAKAYPKEKAFCVTSDWQVFLEKDRGLAVLHQNSLGNGEKIQTIPAAAQ